MKIVYLNGLQSFHSNDLLNMKEFIAWSGHNSREMLQLENMAFLLFSIPSNVESSLAAL